MDLTLDTKVGHVRAMRSRESALCGFVVPAGRAWIQLAPRLQRESPEAAPLLDRYRIPRSFFADETETCGKYFAQMSEWLDAGKITAAQQSE